MRFLMFVVSSMSCIALVVTLATAQEAVPDSPPTMWRDFPLDSLLAVEEDSTVSFMVEAYDMDCDLSSITWLIGSIVYADQAISACGGIDEYAHTFTEAGVCTVFAETMDSQSQTAMVWWEVRVFAPPTSVVAPWTSLTRWGLIKSIFKVPGEQACRD